ncbi:unnamed protein product [Schistocephalus solidus]|uniref:Uncharacterized protein n=1 Tax=Schistocephalus solidus TaxID=70667 RepID=A0A183T7L3_SCHSO|nr:unnamed protein product [Schistocephalus solidus]
MTSGCLPYQHQFRLASSGPGGQAGPSRWYDPLWPAHLKNLRSGTPRFSRISSPIYTERPPHLAFLLIIGQY